MLDGTAAEIAARCGGTAYLDAWAAIAGERASRHADPDPGSDFADFLSQYKIPEFPACFAYFVQSTRAKAGRMVPFAAFVEVAYMRYPVGTLRETIVTEVPPYLSE